jgi:hypothetical protein
MRGDDQADRPLRVPRRRGRKFAANELNCSLPLDGRHVYREGNQQRSSAQPPSFGFLPASPPCSGQTRLLRRLALAEERHWLN